MMHGHGHEGRAWLDRMLARRKADSSEIPAKVEARALSRAGWIAHYFDYSSAAPLLEQSLDLYRRVGEQRGEVEALANLGMMARIHGDYAGAVSRLRQRVERYRELDGPQGLARSLYRLAHLRREQGFFEDAVQLIDECLTLFRSVGDRSGEAAAILSLGDVARDTGNVAETRSRCNESL